MVWVAFVCSWSNLCSALFGIFVPLSQSFILLSTIYVYAYVYTHTYTYIYNAETILIHNASLKICYDISSIGADVLTYFFNALMTQDISMIVASDKSGTCKFHLWETDFQMSYSTSVDFLIMVMPYMVTQIWVNIGLGNGLMPDGTKPLPEPMLISH